MRYALVVGMFLLCSCAEARIFLIPPPVSPGMACTQANCDNDGDGLDDVMEMQLAKRFAPIVYYPADEQYFPLDADWFVGQARVGFYDTGCFPDLVQDAGQRGTQNHLSLTVPDSCGNAERVTSIGSWDKTKSRTFFLYDVGDEVLGKGEVESARWVTYVHVYPNELFPGGITIQYWRFYGHDNGLHLVGPLYLGGHGGDWEAVHLVLDGAHEPRLVWLLGHEDIDEYSWSDKKIQKEDNAHIVISSGLGSHTSLLEIDQTGIRHETAANLVNLGQKTRPFTSFLSYSGLWGSIGWLQRLGIINVYKGTPPTTGYWGPAFNETGMSESSDGFHVAWCKGMAKQLRTKEIKGVRECLSEK